MKKISIILALSLAFVAETFAQVPTITSFAPSSGVVGTTVVITGTNFNTIASNNTVYFGAAKAPIIASTANSCTVTVPSGASFGPITLMRNSGNIAYSSMFFNPTQNCPDDISATSFDTTSISSIYLGPYYTVYGDLDLDGKPEMIVMEKPAAQAYITIYRNTSTAGGAITFAPAISYSVGNSGRNIALGDLNGDGKLDIANLNRVDGTVSVLINTSTVGSINFNAAVNYLVSYGQGGEGIAISDLNKDGKPDIAVATGNGATTDSIAVLQNQNVTAGAAFNSGSFMHYTTYYTGNTGNGLGIADLDGDSFDDVVCSNNGSNNLSIFLNTSTAGGNITLGSRQTVATGGSPFNLSLGDVNDDGKIDIAVGINGTSGFRIHENNSTPGVVSFISNTILGSSTNGSRDADIVDINGDGKLDVVASCSTAELLVVVLNNNQTGSIGASGYFAAADTFNLPIGTSPRDVSVADLNADGKMDMVTLSLVTARITIFRNLVNGGPFMTSASSATICSGSPVGITFSATPSSSPVTYLWKTASTPSVAGESTTNQTASSLTNTLSTIAGVTTDQVLTYTVTPSSSLCPTGISHPQLVNVTVSPKPIISNTTITICSGDGFTITPSGTTIPAGTTYSWLAPAVTGSMTGGAAGSGTVITGVLTNTNATNRTGTYIITPISGSCAGSTFTLTVTVNPKAIIGATTSTVCSGATFTAALGGVIPAGTTYSWASPTVSGGMTGGASAANSINVTGSLTNTTATNQTATYTITPTSGSCTGNAFTYTVTIKPIPNITSTNLPLVICTGTSFTMMPSGTIPAGTTYSWPVPSVTSGMTGGATGTNAATIAGNLTNTTSTSQNATYTITPTANACVGSAFTVVVPISPKPVIPSTTATVCTGNTFIANPSGTIPAGTTYSWPLPSVTAGITGGATGSAASSITGLLNNSTAINQSATYTITPTAGTCTGPVFNVTITVNPKPTVNSATLSVCSGNTISATPSGTIPAGTTYSWGLPTVTGGMTGGTTGSGASTISGSLTNTTAVNQTATYTINPLAGSCAGSAFNVTLTVNPKPSIAAATKTVCTGVTFTASPSGTIPVGTTYSWSLPTVTGAMTGASTGSNASSITGLLTNTTSTDQTATYIITPTSGSCPGATFILTVTVNPKPTIAATSGTVCSGTMFTANPIGTIPAGTTYSWALPTVTGGMTGGATGSSVSSITGLLTNTTAVNQTATYTITPTAGSCSGSVFTGSVVINPKPTISATTATICTGITFTATTSGTIPSGTTYSWGIPTAPSMTGGATGSGASMITGLLTNTTTTAKVAIYTITPTAGSCSGSAFTLSVTVNPKPTITSASSTTICSGNSVALSLLSSVPSNYSWVATNNLYTSGESTVSVNTATITDVVSTTNAATQTVVYNVVATSTAGSCVSNTQTVSVKIDYIPNANAGTDQNVVCTNSAYLIANQVTAPNTGAWSLVPGPSPPTFSNAYNTSVFPLNGSPSATTYYMVWTITNGAAFCPAKRDTVKLIADFNNGLCTPGADYHYSSGTNSGVFSGGTENICINTTVSFTDNSQSANTWDWDFDYTGTFGSNSSAQNPTYTYTSTGAHVCRLKIHSNTTGLDYTKDYTITVIGPPTAPTSISGTTSGICAGNTQLGYSTPLVTNATIYNWTLPSGSSIVSNAGDYSLINVLYSSSATDGTMTVNAANGCGTSANYAQLISISEVPAAAGAISETNNNTTFCQGANNITFTVPVIAGASTYVWNLPNGVGASNTMTTATNAITVNISPTASSGTISVYGTNTCSTSGTSSALTITVSPSPDPVFSITGSAAVCSGTLTSYTASSPSSTGIVWSFLPIGSATTSDVTTSADITFNTAGTTTVTAAHQGSCGNGTAASFTVAVNSLPVAAGPITGSASVCQDQAAASYSVPSITNATSYNWTTPIGTTITGGFNTNNITVDWTASTGGVMSVYAVNGCGNGNASSNYSVVVNALPNVAAIASNSAICLGSMVALSGGGAQTYSWTPASVINNIAFTPSSTSTYTVMGTDVNGCKNTETVSVTVVAPLTPSICMVTVDSMSINNVIYWDNSGFDVTDSIFIYRDIANNNYVLIGKQPYSSVQFADTVRSLYTANGDPNASSWRYKIALKDSCGNISQSSPFHQTIFFQDNSGNFNWSPYQIEGQALPVPALNNYVFTRDDLSTNNWNTIQTLSASSTLYTDASYATYQTTGQWRVETQWSITCGGVAQKVSAISKSRSNIKNNNLVIITNVKSLSSNDFVMMPNPANDYVEINLSKNTSNTLIEIIDVVGRVVVSEKVIDGETKISITTSQFANGIYTVRLTSDSGNSFKKLIIER